MPPLPLLMVQPTEFTVTSYGDNPYMTGTRKPNREKAMRQWKHLYHTLVDSGLTVTVYPNAKGLADMVFAANAGTLVGQTFYPSNFLNPSRKRESAYFKTYLAKMGYKLSQVQGIFEGQGDTVSSNGGGHIWIGYGIRTSLAGATSFARQAEDELSIGLKTHLLHLKDPHFYHLDTCFRTFHNTYAIYYPGAFNSEGIKTIRRHFGRQNLIEVTRREALDFVCNAITIPDKSGQYQSIYLANRIAPRVRRLLHQKNVGSLEIPMSEFLLAGGAVKCCILELGI